MLNILRVQSKDLYMGMYVSALDRPWLDTPFLTQGFYIEAREDIDRLREHCDYVLVDVRKSRYLAAELTVNAFRSRPIPLKGRKLDSRPRLAPEQIFHNRPIEPYRDDTAWEEEHPKAKQALDTLLQDINDIYSEVIEGGNIDVIKLKKSVGPIVASISRNPDACLWVSRLKMHDEYTYQHSLGAAIWSVSLGRQLGLPKRDLRSLAMGCLLMDVGKLRVKPELLRANRELNLEEAAQIASHVEYGLEIIMQSGITNPDVIDMVAHHHERFDGSGYPDGLKEDTIPTFARIAAIVDTYDAVTSKRDYAEAISPPDAIKLLYNSRDVDFQAELVEAFIQAVGIYPAGTLVELSSGEVAVVVAEYRARRLRPKVMVLLDAQKNKLEKSVMLDLREPGENNNMPALSIVRGLDPDVYGIDLAQVQY
ncbi:MAG: HD-GYP domain-containing protein [Proteobacteria bacterium]|nr:HD-GYP domain-containing protein [Pseudomonadota bacterium]